MLFLVLHNIPGRDRSKFDEGENAAEEVFRHSNTVMKFQVARHLWKRGESSGTELWPGEEGEDDWHDAFERA